MWDRGRFPGAVSIAPEAPLRTWFLLDRRIAGDLPQLPADHLSCLEPRSVHGAFPATGAGVPFSGSALAHRLTELVAHGAQAAARTLDGAVAEYDPDRHGGDYECENHEG